jgi:3-oxoacyl-[acyl-carrier protein] reductase
MKPLDGKVALVTGSSQGIGRGIAERLGKNGAQVVINYAGNEAAADEVVAQIINNGGEAITAQGDVSNLADIERLFNATLERFGKLDILVNNAGVATLLPLPEITEAEFDRVFNLNAKGTLFCLKQAALHLADQGRVVNIASSTVDFPTEGAYIYAGSKAAVKKYTQIAAQELGQRGITVNTVTPGVTETPMSSRLPASFMQPAIESSPFKRLGKPDGIAAVVAFLASDDARWITGQDILVNGGAKQ